MGILKVGCVVAMVLASSSVLSSPSWAQAAKPEDVRALMRDAGVEALLVQAIDKMIVGVEPMLRQVLKDAPPDFTAIALDEMKKGFRQSSGDFLGLAAGLYGEAFSADEIRQLRAFYASDVGRKIVAKQPEIMAKSMKGGEALGQRIAMDALDRAKRRYQAENPTR